VAAKTCEQDDRSHSWAKGPENLPSGTWGRASRRGSPLSSSRAAATIGRPGASRLRRWPRGSEPRRSIDANRPLRKSRKGRLA